ncbi:putative Replication factor C subunit 4 [Paratrimastix pyriformis]|uniref:Replication factor C subunit 4 n=1 Tax=Paratrimastix pyriformis TaxID=342808 RepID=A0ABQ8UX50_9EUKA|nr:putative Replication factor C subunit 4 [Paratrimastix pyriformis]
MEVEAEAGEPVINPQQDEHAEIEAEVTEKKNPKTDRLLPWVEKFRPKVLADVVYQDEVISPLRQFLQAGNLPHLLFYGPPGTGKTSTILALAHELYGPDLYHSRVMELNASDERGINVIREKVKVFAKGSVTHRPASVPPPHPRRRRVSGLFSGLDWAIAGGPCLWGGPACDGAPRSNYRYPAPQFKLIVLDEADSLTADAQSALRRVMETHARVTRFCLVCNYISRIIEPVASRCAKFRFRVLPPESALTRLRAICASEGVQCPDQALLRSMQLSEGDLRQAITLLQSAHRLYGGALTPEMFTELAGVVPEDRMGLFTRALRSNSFDHLQRAIGGLLADGFPAQQIIAQVAPTPHATRPTPHAPRHDRHTPHATVAPRLATISSHRTPRTAPPPGEQLLEWVVEDPELSDVKKADIAYRIAQTEKALADGASEELQIGALGAAAMETICLGARPAPGAAITTTTTVAPALPQPRPAAAGAPRRPAK